MNIIDTERDKYAELWSDVPAYRNYSPGLENVSRFMDVMKPEPYSSLIDIGCGTGDAGLEFQRRGLDVSWIDITDAGLNKDVPRDHFIQAPLWMAWERHLVGSDYGYDYGFCCDVMEHIPTEFSMLVVDRIVSVCEVAWFHICLVPDQFGSSIGQPLHLTVKPFGWWLERLKFAGDVIDARDLCQQALFVVRK